MVEIAQQERAPVRANRGSLNSNVQQRLELKQRSMSRMNKRRSPGQGFLNPVSSPVASPVSSVEMGGIEPPSIAEDLRLLRAQLVRAFYSAPTFATSI